MVSIATGVGGAWCIRPCSSTVERRTEDARVGGSTPSWGTGAFVPLVKLIGCDLIQAGSIPVRHPRFYSRSSSEDTF